MTPAALILASSIDISGTTITLRDTTMPGAEAEIAMDNIATNDQGDNGAYLLSLRDLEVWFTFQWESGPAGADAIHVDPPEGMICQPASCVLELLEGSSGVLYLFPWSGM